jgi:hypothetical protein
MPDTGYTSAQQLDAKKRLAYNAYIKTGLDYYGGQDSSHCSGGGAYFRMWDFILKQYPPNADCQDMSAWWHKLCNSVGLSVNVRRISGPFYTKDIDPVGSPGWQTTDWSFHQIGWSSNVFDACLQLSQSQTSPYSDARVPQDENITSPYKRDLYSSGDWNEQSPFSLTEVN